VESAQNKSCRILIVCVTDHEILLNIMQIINGFFMAFVTLFTVCGEKLCGKF